MSFFLSLTQQFFSSHYSNNDNDSWPANSDETISIGAVSKRDNLPVADFSNSNEKIDYAGIGVDVISFRPGGKYQYMSGKQREEITFTLSSFYNRHFLLLGFDSYLHILVALSCTGTSMACPHVCGFLAALMTKGGKYEDLIKDDASARKTLNENFLIDIGAKGRDNMTGLGFLTYLSKEEFEEGFLDLPDH